jgi:hypothetical protein
MAVKYDEGGYTPPKPPKPVTDPWQQQQTQTPKPVTYASTPTPRPQQTPTRPPATTPTPPPVQPLSTLWNSFTNWFQRNVQTGGTPVSQAQQWNAQQIWSRSRPGPTTGVNSPGRSANPYASPGYNTPWTPNPYLRPASSGASQDPRNNPAFWRSAGTSNSTTTGGLNLGLLSQIANNPNANNTELRYFYNPYQRVQYSGINPTRPTAPSSGGGWGYGGGGGGGGGYTPTPYLPQWYLNPGLWRI